jgi:SAM-dependent methyltransferase
MELRDSFDTVAALYDRARPTYPEKLVDDLVAALPGRRVLEIGCGTGKLTRALVERGLDVTCVEPGANLAAIAARSAPVIVERFEDWTPDGVYDAVCCATAWHWLDPEIAPRKVHELLRPGGVLGVIGTHHVVPPDADRFFREIQVAYDAIGEGVTDLADVGDIRHSDADALRATGLFEVEDRGYVRTIDYDASAYIDLLNTYSGHITMSDDERSTIFDAVRRLAGDRTIRKHHLFCLHLARKVD